MDQHPSSRVARTNPPRSRRSSLREERHPNAVTAPPVHRGSMAPRPWRGFWNSIGTALLPAAGACCRAPARRARAAGPEPGSAPARRRRLVFALLTLLSTVLASWLFASAQPDYGNAWLEYGQIALFALLSAWVVTGFVTALMGFWVSLRGDRHALSAAQVRRPRHGSASAHRDHHADLQRGRGHGVRRPARHLRIGGGHRPRGRVRRVRAVRQLRPRHRSRRARRLGRPAHRARRAARSSPRSRSTTACASAAPTARPATWPTSAAAGARTTATWSCWTPTA